MSLTIRKMKQDDFDELYALLSDPNTMKYLEEPYSKAKAKRFLVEAGLSATPLIYAVEFKNHFIGYIIYHSYDANSIEIGWVISPEYRGKGVASKLTEQLIETKDTKKDLVIECVPEQLVTKHIAQKYGFVFEKNENGLDIYRLKR